MPSHRICKGTQGAALPSRGIEACPAKNTVTYLSPPGRFSTVGTPSRAYCPPSLSNCACRLCILVRIALITSSYEVVEDVNSAKICSSI